MLHPASAQPLTVYAGLIRQLAHKQSREEERATKAYLRAKG